MTGERLSSAALGRLSQRDCSLEWVILAPCMPMNDKLDLARNLLGLGASSVEQQKAPMGLKSLLHPIQSDVTCWLGDLNCPAHPAAHWPTTLTRSLLLYLVSKYCYRTNWTMDLDKERRTTLCRAELRPELCYCLSTSLCAIPNVLTIRRPWPLNLCVDPVLRGMTGHSGSQIWGWLVCVTWKWNTFRDHMTHIAGAK